MVVAVVVRTLRVHGIRPRVWRFDRFASDDAGVTHTQPCEQEELACTAD